MKLAWLALTMIACGPEPLPPLGEALIIVDTDLPVPTIASRLRIDIYTGDGRWYESRELRREQPGDWPVSFSVYDPDPNRPRDLLVRLRAFPAGIVRDYHGERFALRPDGGKPSDIVPDPPIPDGEGPRLLDENGIDRTPATEPQPLVTVDRLVSIHLEPARRAAVRVVLRGRCAGTMVDFDNRTTCIDEENVRVPVVFAALDPNRTIGASVVGTFAPPAPCQADVRPPTTNADGTPLFDEEVCVPGGAFLFGNAINDGLDRNSDAPVRVAVMPPFRIDRYEVSVGRWRAALAAGFKSKLGSPVANEGPITPAQVCTWSTSPQKREGFPLACVTYQDARAFCQFMGGDLPTEAQWEYVAQAVGRTQKTHYSWGNEEPTCERVVFARDYGTNTFSNRCGYLGKGPQALSLSSEDVAIGTGVVDLTGGMAEIAADAPYPFKSVCWASQGLDSPHCDDPTELDFLVRGGAWFFGVLGLEPGNRDRFLFSVGVGGGVGFRCVRAIP